MEDTEFEVSAGVTGLTADQVAAAWDKFVAAVEALGGEVGGGFVPRVATVTDEQK